MKDQRCKIVRLWLGHTHQWMSRLALHWDQHAGADGLPGSVMHMNCYETLVVGLGRYGYH